MPVPAGGVMILIQGRGMRLRDYVQQRQREDQARGSSGIFGESADGDIASRFVRNFTFISFLYPASDRDEQDDSEKNMVFISIPPTCRGLHPYNEADLPYGWTGQINEYVAEMAVSWAFDLLTEEETGLFLNRHRPTVIFRYNQDGRIQDLPVFFNGMFWEIMTGGVQ